MFVATRFATALATNDIDGVVALLTDDAWFTMPPVTLEYQGPEAIAGFLRDISNWKGLRHYRWCADPDPGQRPARLRVLPAGSPGAGVRYARMIVLPLEGNRIAAINRLWTTATWPGSGCLRCSGVN